MLSRKPLDFRRLLVILHECSVPCQKQLFAYIPDDFHRGFSMTNLICEYGRFFLFLVLRNTQRPSARFPCQQI